MLKISKLGGLGTYLSAPNVDGALHAMGLNKHAPSPDFDACSALPLPAANNASGSDHLSCSIRVNTHA